MKLLGGVVLGGLALFIATVAALHLAQPDYDQVYQLMSELALGAHGGWMLAAFLGLATSASAAALASLRWRAPLLPVLLAGAALGFLGAGLVPLGPNAEIHIASISAAFVLVVLAMVLLPRMFVSPLPLPGREWSGLLAAATAVSVALGHGVVPIGIAQRAAALCGIAWLIWIGVAAVRGETQLTDARRPDSSP